MVCALPDGEDWRHDGALDEKESRQRTRLPRVNRDYGRCAGDPSTAAERAKRGAEEGTVEEAPHGGPQAKDSLRWPHEPNAQDDPHERHGDPADQGLATRPQAPLRYANWRFVTGARLDGQVPLDAYHGQPQRQDA